MERLHPARPSLRLGTLAALMLGTLLTAQQDPRRGNGNRPDTAPAAQRIVPYPIDLPPAFLAAVDKGTRTLDGKPGAKQQAAAA